MQNRPSRPLLLELTSHLAMGAGLGTLLALLLIICDASQIYQMIINSSAPRFMMMIFLTTFASIFAVGAALTGLIFVQMQDE